MTRFRPFHNGDPPALADLWNRGLPRRYVVESSGPDSVTIWMADFMASGLEPPLCP